MHAQMLHASPLVTSMLVSCDMRRSGPHVSYPVNQTWIGFGLTGVFSVHAREDVHVVHPGRGVVFPRGIEYRMSHPTDDGDTGLTLGFAPAVVEEAFPGRCERVRVTGLDLQLRYAVGLFMAAAAERQDALAVDEMALALLRAMAARTATAERTSPRARQRVERVRQLLASAPERRWTLEQLARIVGCSPFHLAHQFRAHTGTTIHRYLADLRAAVALRRIETGDHSLATVAVDLGFSHHSHLTATLRRRLGVTPTMIRARRT